MFRLTMHRCPPADIGPQYRQPRVSGKTMHTRHFELADFCGRRLADTPRYTLRRIKFHTCNACAQASRNRATVPFSHTRRALMGAAEGGRPFVQASADQLVVLNTFD